MATKKRILGNPALITAAPYMAEKVAPQVIKIVNHSGRIMRYVAIGIGGVIVFVAANKAIKYNRRQKYLSLALTDPNVMAASKIYDAIPAGLKKGSGGIFNPFGFIKDIGNKIALIWKNTDSSAILQIAQQNITDVSITAKAFKAIYNEDLLELLKKVLTDAEFDQFAKGVNAKKFIPNNVVNDNTNLQKHIITSNESIGYVVEGSTIKAVSNGAIKPMRNRIAARTYLGQHTGYEYTSPYVQQNKKIVYAIIKTDIKRNNQTIFIAMPKKDIGSIDEKKKGKFQQINPNIF